MEEHSTNAQADAQKGDNSGHGCSKIFNALAPFLEETDLPLLFPLLTQLNGKMSQKPPVEEIATLSLQGDVLAVSAPLRAILAYLDEDSTLNLTATSSWSAAPLPIAFPALPGPSPSQTPGSPSDFSSETERLGLPESVFDATKLVRLLSRRAFLVRAIRLNRCRNTVLRALPAHFFARVEALDLGGNSYVSDISPLSQATRLVELCLRGCACYDLTALRGCGERLRVLDVSECERLTDLSGCEALSALELLSLRDCVALTDTSALGALEKLREVEVEGCKALLARYGGGDGGSSSGTTPSSSSSSSSTAGLLCPVGLNRDLLAGLAGDMPRQQGRDVGSPSSWLHRTVA